MADMQTPMQNYHQGDQFRYQQGNQCHQQRFPPKGNYNMYEHGDQANVTQRPF
jgi:hypothetical protein